MGLVVDVPATTILADLDETLRALLRRELGRHGFEGVPVHFDAPSREWSGQLAAPAVNLFLYDLREADQRRVADWEHVRANGHARDVRPPLVLDCSYAVTAWTQAVEDEHRLLSQILAILFAYRRLPTDLLHGRLAASAQGLPIEGRVGEARLDGKADFWSAVGGQYKASIDYVVTLTWASGTADERGPQVRTQTIASKLLDAPHQSPVALQRIGGRVLDPEGRPQDDAWVTLPELGRSTASDSEGRFRLERVPTGRHRCVARAVDGRQAEAELEVPGRVPDLVLDAASPKKAGT